MRVNIHHTMSFKMKYTRDREEILKAKIHYLKFYKSSDALIEGLLYAQGYNLKEINSVLNSFTPTYKYSVEKNKLTKI